MVEGNELLCIVVCYLSATFYEAIELPKNVCICFNFLSICFAFKISCFLLGILLLAEVLEHLRLKPLDDASIHTLVGFFTERLVSMQLFQ